MSGGGLRLKLIFGLTGATLLYLLILPTPSDMASFWVGCSSGNFQPTDTCLRVCRMLGNLSSCCYGVNYSGRTACGCCAEVNQCPRNCNTSCVMVIINTEGCAGSNAGHGREDDSQSEDPVSSLIERMYGSDLIPVPVGLPKEEINPCRAQQQMDLGKHETLVKPVPPKEIDAELSSPNYDLFSILNPLRNASQNQH